MMGRKRKLDALSAQIKSSVKKIRKHDPSFEMSLMDAFAAAEMGKQPERLRAVLETTTHRNLWDIYHYDFLKMGATQ